MCLYELENTQVPSLKMRAKTQLLSLLIFFLCHDHLLRHLQAQPPPSIEGFTCTANHTIYPCQAYAFYRAKAPNFLHLFSIGYLFSVSRLMISKPSNISDPYSVLVPDQQLFVPLTCSRNTINASFSISSANLSYTIQKGDTFYLVSTDHFRNLTTYQSVEVVNPSLVPTKLEVGDNAIFPIFCKCPNQTQKRNQVNYLVSYVFQPSDNLSQVAATFGVDTNSITNFNGNNIRPLDTIFIPVSKLPQLAQPVGAPSPVPSGKTERKGLITGLAVGLGITGFLLVFVIGFCFYRERMFKKQVEKERDEEKQRQQFYMGGKGLKEMEANLMADVSECLDKYRMFKIDELREATDGFSENCLIQGSVYKGSIDGNHYAIKKMKWNAREELKILQKVEFFFPASIPYFFLMLVWFPMG